MWALKQMERALLKLLFERLNILFGCLFEFKSIFLREDNNWSK